MVFYMVGVTLQTALSRTPFEAMDGVRLAGGTVIVEFGVLITLASVSPASGFLYLMAFSLGLGILFLPGAFVSRVSWFLRKTGGVLTYYGVMSGVLLVAVGLLVVTNCIGVLQIFLNGIGPLPLLANPLSLIIALSAGFLTFISPCMLPLVPAFLARVSGISEEAAVR